MKSSVIASILAYTAIANASPVLVRSQMCNVAPAATPASAPAPLSSPSATTAIGCQQKCEADSSCQCFVFGLPPSAAAPKCILFAVPASQVPAQGTNLHVFDKACAASAVPTQAPTAAHPQGPANGSSSSSSSNGNGSAANGSGSGTGASKQDTQGKRVNGNGGAASGNGAAANNGKGSAANGNGAANSGKGAANSGNTTPNSGNGAATGSSNQNTQGNANVCGAAPSGPSQNPPSPFQTQANVASQQACLDLCQQTDGCKSCEFGSQSANGAKQCMLFKVPAAQLPPPSNGQSLVAFDTGC